MEVEVEGAGEGEEASTQVPSQRGNAEATSHWYMVHAFPVLVFTLVAWRPRWSFYSHTLQSWSCRLVVCPRPSLPTVARSLGLWLAGRLPSSLSLPPS